MTNTLQPLTITMGCPVGIGPEIILKFFYSRPSSQWNPVVIGSKAVLENCAETLGMDMPVFDWQPGTNIQKDKGIPVFDPLSGDQDINKAVGALAWGKPNAVTGKMMATYIETAVRLIFNKQAAGMITCPITKKTLQLAGYKFPGHTEMLAALCKTEQFAMMMAGKKLRVTLVSIHEPYTAVPELLSIDRIVKLARMTNVALRNDFGLRTPRLAVAGLNPHAGESGLFGEEEQGIIGPAIELLRDENINISGPFPPDTIFVKAARGEYDAVICMYHDQGLIPFKLLHFDDGVNVTIGLPIVRTSVDHGTAYDIAGKGVASSSSLSAAFLLAGEISHNRTKI